MASATRVKVCAHFGERVRRTRASGRSSPGGLRCAVLAADSRRRARRGTGKFLERDSQDSPETPRNEKSFTWLLPKTSRNRFTCGL
jgi:hypothetical protein